MTRSLERTAYEGILGMLMDGRLARGAVVSEASLAKGMGISRTPVRHAIRQLEAQGLVEQIPKLGTIARPPDRHELGEIFDAREAIEGHVAALAAERSIPTAHLETLQALCDQLLAIGKEARRLKVPHVADVPMPLRLQWYEADLGFHRVLLDAVNNRRLNRVYGDLQMLTSSSAADRLLDRAFTPVQLAARAYVEHSRILRAIRRRDADAARRLMVAHIRRKKDSLLQQMLREEAAGTPERDLWGPGRSSAELELLSRLEGSGGRPPNAAR